MHRIITLFLTPLLTFIGLFGVILIFFADLQDIKKDRGDLKRGGKGK